MPHKASGSATAKMTGWILKEGTGTIPVDVGMIDPCRSLDSLAITFPFGLIVVISSHTSSPAISQKPVAINKPK